MGKNFGGLPRRAAFIKEYRRKYTLPDSQEKKDNTLLLDCGNVIDNNSPAEALTARFILDAMNLMAYDAVTIGGKDLLLGEDTLRGYAERIDFPITSANLRGDHPFWKPYVIREVGGVRVAILGVLDPGYVPKGAFASAQSCGDAVKEAIQTLKAQADIVVLLCQMGYKGTLALVKEVPGIDIAIIGSGYKNTGPETAGDTIVAGTPPKGKSIGEIVVTWDPESKSISSFEGSIHPLTSDVESDPEMFDWVDSEKTKILEALNQKKEEDAENEKRLKEMLNMPPGAFLEQLKNKNEEHGKE